MRSYQLLEPQEPEARRAQDPTQEMVQVVPRADRAQRGEEVVCRFKREALYFCPGGRLVKWYNFGLQNRRRRFDSYIARIFLGVKIKPCHSKVEKGRIKNVV